MILTFFSMFHVYVHKLCSQMNTILLIWFQTWIATGNCFSLQKEHDVAIKFFRRAIQVDPDYAYAYTLLAHEYVFIEELDKALACFRNGLRVDSRHYNAWLV